MGEPGPPVPGSDPDTADVLVLGGIVVTMDQGRTILPDGGIAIRGDRMVAVGAREEIASSYRTATVIDAAGDLVVPGLIDAPEFGSLRGGGSP